MLHLYRTAGPSGRPAAPAARRRRSFNLAGLALLALVASAGPAQGEPQPPPAAGSAGRGGLTLLAPAPGQALYTNRLAQVVVTGPEPLRWLRDGVVARIALESGSQTLLLAEGDLRSLQSLDAIDALVDLSDVPPGSYELSVEVEGAGRVSAAVSVNLPPVGSLALEAAEPTEQGWALTFVVSAESPGGIPLDGFLWDFGDGSPPVPTDEPSTEHVYEELAAPVTVAVEVRDELGGADQVVAMLVPGARQEEPVLKEAPACACDEMRIFHGQGTTTAFYCAPAAPGGGLPPEVTRYPECRAAGAQAPPGTCPPGEVAFLCDRGALQPALPGNPRFGYSFEVVGFLKPGSDAALCEEGQYARATLATRPVPTDIPKVRVPPPTGAQTLPRSDDSVFGFNAVEAGKPYPPRDADDWGSDDYATPKLGKQHDGEVRWIDLPGFLTVAPLASASFDYEFIAFVRPRGGGTAADTCWCRFTIQQTWTPAQGVRGAGLTRVDGNDRCVFVPRADPPDDDGVPALPAPWMALVLVVGIGAVAARLILLRRRPA